MSRRARFRTILASLLFSFPAARFAESQRGPAPPNLVVIMADDLDVDALDALLERGLLPNLQSHVVEPGHDFRESFVSYPLCCPSRATFLTGKYAHNHGVEGNGLPLGGATRVDDRSTVATWLRDAGYRTAHVGKYLNGYGADKGHSNDSPKDDPTYVPPGWSEWYGLVDPSTYRVFDFDVNENGVVTHYSRGPNDENYQTDVLAELASDFVRGASEPFLLVVTPLAPHIEPGLRLPNCRSASRLQAWGSFIRPDPKDAFEKPASWEAVRNHPLLPQHDPSFREPDMSDKPAWLRRWLSPMTDADVECLTGQYRSRLGSMLAVDDLVGELVQALQERSAMERTVLVFTSDNGYMQGQHHMDSKLFAYEESARVPLYIRMPEGGARQVDALVLNNDLAPTLAELAGALVPPDHQVDGRSLLPLLGGAPPADWRMVLLIESRQYVTYSAIRTAPGAVLSGMDVANRLYVEYTELERFGRPLDDVEHYELDSDPFQLRSLHRDPRLRAERAALSRRLAELRNCAGAGCMTAENR